MSRGFSEKEASKLLVRAKFNKILEKIEDEEIKNEILYEIDNRLNQLIFPKKDRERNELIYG